MKKTAMALCVAMATLSQSAMSAPVKSEKQANAVIQYRQALLQLVKSNVGVLGAMSKGKIEVDAQVVETNAQRIKQLSLMMKDYFAGDTSKFNMKSDALPKIWTEFDQFSIKADALTEAASALEMAAKSGDEGQIVSSIGPIFKSCKGCHDSYKAD